MSRTQVWSCGGGVQSVAIAVLIVQGRLPKPDLAVMSDTERERSAVWSYFDEVLQPQLKSVGVNLVRLKKSDWEKADLWQGEEQTTLSIPAYFTQTDGSIGRVSGFCSDRWKTRVVRRWMRAQGVKEATTWLGISLDEMRRVRAPDVQWIDFRYPLIWDVPMRREGCLKLIREAGWPPPPRSACWMCANRENSEWRALRDEDPPTGDWQRAIDLELEIQAKHPHATFHRSGLNLNVAPIDEPDDGQLNFNQCAGMCWT